MKPHSDSNYDGDRYDGGEDRQAGGGLYDDLECISCSFLSGAKTAKLLVASRDWDFYYCYSCKGWFRRHFQGKTHPLPVRDGGLIRALNWYYSSELEAAEGALVVTNGFHKLWGRFRDFYISRLEPTGRPEGEEETNSR